MGTQEAAECLSFMISRAWYSIAVSLTAINGVALDAGLISIEEFAILFEEQAIRWSGGGSINNCSFDSNGQGAWAIRKSTIKDVIRTNNTVTNDFTDEQYSKVTNLNHCKITLSYYLEQHLVLFSYLR